MLLIIIVCVLLQTTQADDVYDYGKSNNETHWIKLASRLEEEDPSQDIRNTDTEGQTTRVDILRTNTQEEDITNENSTINGTIEYENYNVTVQTTIEAFENDSNKTVIDNANALDVPALINLIMNLTSDIESNLTMRLNETLQSMSLPTCGTPATIPTTTSEYDANYTGSVVAKCFVCGLEVHGVPAHAHCADAFAGDFLPLVPVDPTAKSKVSRYRKYCKYQNIPGFAYNSSDTRSIFGRWTGGCAVRWVDLSGIYTQRTCRSRLAPSVGKHYGSKRMAKLEKALWMVDNGCIVSPMASLVPLSRGVSLYARFHACVCTGSWCNVAPTVGLHMMNLAPLLLAILNL